LRAKYLDWCSAQVADHFLALSADEIFELAERAAREESKVEDAAPAAPLPAELSSYRAMVDRVAGVLTQQLELPGFEEWLELYRADPAGVEERLIGFWKDMT
jgi:hypothetical protein